MALISSYRWKRKAFTISKLFLFQFRLGNWGWTSKERIIPHFSCEFIEKGFLFFSAILIGISQYFSQNSFHPRITQTDIRTHALLNLSCFRSFSISRMDFRVKNIVKWKYRFAFEQLATRLGDTRIRQRQEKNHKQTTSIFITTSFLIHKILFRFYFVLVQFLSDYKTANSSKSNARRLKISFFLLLLLCAICCRLHFHFHVVFLCFITKGVKLA